MMNTVKTLTGNKGGAVMKKPTKVILALLALLIIGFIYYYVTLPAINIHAGGFWTFLIVLLAVLVGFYILSRLKKGENIKDVKQNKLFKIGIGAILLVVVVYLIGSLLSSPIVNAKKYQKLLTVKDGEFTEDIDQVSFDQIPLLDRDSATLLGNRKMGSLVEMVSQFEVSPLYTQINYKGRPVRVSPLQYASPIKWLTNRKEGIPAYMMIDMANQDTECVKLENGIKYSPSEYFNRNIYRHLRFNYPTYIFDEISFELDEEGTPYWVCPVKKYSIGLFGGQVIGRVVLCNAITGETMDYPIEDVPSWIDRAYSADLLVQLFDYYGTLKHGYFNSILGQKDCLQTTNGYNFIAQDDDVWVYTGVTSVTADQSNVGFVLMNQRTMETKFYKIEGAVEVSAMSSAEGQVQNLGYRATFPLLLNIANEPTYFIALKDDAGLVKKYAMVNVQKYQLVAIGDTVQQCEKQYITLLNTSGISAEATAAATQSKTGVIAKIAQGVIEGNSHYYLMLEGSDEIFDVSVVEFLDIIRYNVGDRITIEYTPGANANIALGISKE